MTNTASAAGQFQEDAFIGAGSTAQWAMRAALEATGTKKETEKVKRYESHYRADASSNDDSTGKR
jgi:hypothetical protein